MRADADADAAPRAASADANARVVGADASDARDARNDAVRGRDVEGDVDRARDGDAPTVSSVVDALVKHHLAEREGKRTSRMPSHEFWETQPVRQFGEDTSRGAELREGPIDPPKLASETSESGGALPPGYSLVGGTVYTDGALYDTFKAGGDALPAHAHVSVQGLEVVSGADGVLILIFSGA